MHKRNPSLPAVRISDGARPKSRSSAEIRYSKTSPEFLEIRWTNITPTTDVNKAGTCKQSNYRENNVPIQESYTMDVPVRSKQIQGKENEWRIGRGQRSLKEFNTNTNVKVASPLLEGSTEDFNNASDMDIKQKGMAKGHYIDKAAKKNCTGCGRQFKLKRKPRHCRRCGEVFCINCVKYRRKLNYMAHPDPEGKLRKVCKSCFEEDSLVLGCTRDLSDLFFSERTFARYARMMNKRINSLTTTFWPDQIDRREECTRLINGFQQDVRQLGPFEALRVKLKTPGWQKSKYWDIEIKANKCRSCKGDVGLRKSRGNCRVCGLALCRKCSNKDLLLFFDNDITKLAIINVPGGPLHEPDISLLLYVCDDCKTYISEQQTSNLLWYKNTVERNVVDDMRDIDVKFEDLKAKAESSILKTEQILDKAVENDLPAKEEAVVSTEIENLRTTLNCYEKDLKTVRSWLEQNLLRTETTLLNNFIKQSLCMHTEQKRLYHIKCRDNSKAIQIWRKRLVNHARARQRTYHPYPKKDSSSKTIYCPHND